MLLKENIDFEQLSSREDGLDVPEQGSGGSPMSTSSDHNFGFEMSEDETELSLMLITANVGSVFEHIDKLLKQWVDQIGGEVAQRAPKFVAMHFQEVGGKSVRESLHASVQIFTSTLIARIQNLGFTRHLALFDLDIEHRDRYTALGSLYFVHKSLHSVQIFDFQAGKFVDFDSSMSKLGNLDKSDITVKQKFPLEFFPNGLWSRKGFLRTQWQLNKCAPIELVNVHLFHDACNLVAFFESWPSIYSSHRRRALEHLLEHVNVQNPLLFVFGDFNFRLDGPAVLQHLIEHLKQRQMIEQQLEQQLGQQLGQQHRQRRRKHSYSVVDSSDKVRLCVRRKEFYVDCLDEMLQEKWLIWQQFDNELHHLQGKLKELSVNFRPTYPFEERFDRGSKYMRTRCPAWCDRILFSPATEHRLNNAHYGVLGEHVVMGDHKPVVLTFSIKNEQ